MKMPKISLKLNNEVKTTRLNQAKNTMLAAFIFGSVGAYVAVNAMNSIDARQSDRVNAALRAQSAHVTAPVSPAAVEATPGK